MLSLKEHCLAAIVLMLLANMQTVCAFEEGKTAFLEEAAGETAEPAQETRAPKRDEFTCGLEEMPDADSQNFLDLLRDGFLGSDYKSDDGNNTPREELQNPTIIIPIDKEEGTAQKIDLASQKFDANEAQHIMNDWIQGPYSYGLVLTDTLRVGRCVNLKDQNIPCPVEGKQLQYRNSGTGFSSDFKPIGEFFREAADSIRGTAESAGEKIGEKITGKDYNFVDKDRDEWTDHDYERMRESMGLPENAQESLTEYAASSDFNETEVHTMSRTVEKMIANSILTQDFYAYSQTTCNTSDCVINVYSLFDKYYNNWFSVDLVLSNSLPMIANRAKKLFMNIGRRGSSSMFRISDSKLANAIRRKVYNPDTALGKRMYERLGKRMWARSQSIPEVGKLRFELMETTGWLDGMYLVKSRPFRNKLEKEWMTQGGWFDKITDGKIQKEMYQFAEDVRKWQKIQQTLYGDAKSQYLKAFKSGLGTPQEAAARIDFARQTSKLMTASEDLIHLDLPEWISRDASARFYYYALTPQGSDAARWMAHDSIDVYDVMKKFEIDGHFGGQWGAGKTGFGGYKSTGRNLNLYGFDPKAEKIGEATADEIKTHFSQFTDVMVKTDPGDVMPLKDSTLPYVSNVMTGKQPIYAGAIAKTREISPEEFAQRIVNNHRLDSFFSHYGADNSDQLVYALQGKGFMKRRYTSLLDRAMMDQHELMLNYFKPGKGPIKWTAYTNLYWFGKRGFGQEAFSAYMLPDSWREISWPLGSHNIYNDAFIDFFAQEGSDQGDMFRRVLNLLPYEMILGTLVQYYEPAKDAYEKFAQKEIRNEVENLAYYGSTQQDCTGCGVSLDSGKNFQQYSILFFSQDIFKSYMVEDVVSKKAREKGTTLITFSHHTDLEGKESSVPGSGRIGLVEGIAEEKTCNDAVAKMGFGFMPQDSELWKPSMVGGVLAFGESVLYASAFWAGMFGSVLQQVMLAPQLQDCVDVDEGYYTHIFAPAKSERTSESAEVLSTDKAMGMAEGFSGQLLGMFKSDTNSYTSEAAKALDGEVQNFFNSSTENDIVQANVELRGNSSGKLSGEQLFSFWFKGETSPLEYKDEGIKQIGSKDGNSSVVVDFESGKVYMVDKNGNLQLLTDNNLATASSSTNTRIPAEEFGKRFTLVGLPDSAELLFEMNTDGELIVKVPEVIDCIVQGIEFQSGIKTSKEGSDSFNLEPVFGEVQAIVTDSHPSIRAWVDEKRIVAEGTPRLFIEGEGSMVKIFADRNTYLWKEDSNNFVGLMKSIQFKNGVILYKPDSHELLVWLKRHELGQLSSDDVGGARFAPATSFNPETGCPEPAVDLEVLPSEAGGTTAFKVNAFNEALGNVGPFTVLETPTRRFVFFSRYEEDGTCVGIECCKDYFRVINKETGEVYEAPIEDMAVTPDGIKITDGNGKEHTLGLDAKNGVPQITYNNYPPEPLTSAQGQNGSFWYDPERGIWNAENAQLLPLVEAFKNGLLTQVGKDGGVVSRPGDNIMNIQTGSGNGGFFNLPSLPEGPRQLFFYLMALMAATYALVYRRKELKKLAKKS